MNLFIISILLGCGGNAKVVSYTAELKYDGDCPSGGCSVYATIENIPDGYMWRECSCVIDKTWTQEELDYKKAKDEVYTQKYTPSPPVSEYQNLKTKNWKFVVSCGDYRTYGQEAKVECFVVYP